MRNFLSLGYMLRVLLAVSANFPDNPRTWFWRFYAEKNTLLPFLTNCFGTDVSALGNNALLPDWHTNAPMLQLLSCVARNLLYIIIMYNSSGVMLWYHIQHSKLLPCDPVHQVSSEVLLLCTFHIAIRSHGCIWIP